MLSTVKIGFAVSVLIIQVVSAEIQLKSPNVTVGLTKGQIVGSNTQHISRLHVQEPKTGNPAGSWDICGPYGCAIASKVCGEWGCVSMESIYPPWLPLEDNATNDLVRDSVEGEIADGSQSRTQSQSSASVCPIVRGIPCCGEDYECPPFARLDMSIESNRDSLEPQGCPTVNGRECCGQMWECIRIFEPTTPQACPMINGIECCGKPQECALRFMNAQKSFGGRPHVHSVCPNGDCREPQEQARFRAPASGIEQQFLATHCSNNDCREPQEEHRFVAGKQDVESPQSSEEGLKFCGPWGCIPAEALTDHLGTFFKKNPESSDMKSEL